jgi:hypothetical protein
MAMKMATVEILIEKARFEPQTAIAVAEAIDEAMDRRMETTQPVSVPVLDARLAGLKTELLHHIYATFATQMALILGLLYFLFNHAK